MKKITFIVTALLFSGIVYLFYNPFAFDDLKLKLSPFWGYATVRNNPLLEELDPDLAIVDQNARISRELILAGGPPKDGIPAIDNPKFVSTDETSYADEELVIGVVYRGIAKAYPYKILNWHEIVNDTIGDLPIAVTLCPLCDTNPVFIRRVNGKETSFGVSGKLFQSCLVMYDRTSDSLWYQPWGIGLAGKHANAVLKRFPGIKTTLGKWKERHPDTLVLSSETEYQRDYHRSPYGTYDTNSTIIFPVRNQEYRNNHPKAIESILWEADEKNPIDHFSGHSFHISHKKMKDVREKTISFASRRVTVKWDSGLGTVRFFETDGEEIPSTTAYGFVYPAIFNQID